VLVNRRVLESDVRIYTGRIVPHYFAGFSGGRKALIPGVAGFRTIKANHRLTLGVERGLHPNARPCVLDGNPVHLDMLEGARLAGPAFCLNTLLDARHRLVGAVAGASEAAHEEGCRRAGRMFRARLEAPVDAVITSAGGSPYDCNFMQSLKAVMNVREAVRPGGAILWVAECPFGIDPDFLRWAAVESDEALESAVRERYNLKGHNTLMLRETSRRASVALCSALPDESVRAMGFHPVASLDEGVRGLEERLGRGFTYRVAPHANVTSATVTGCQ
jgi:nickel-dependent lactate racemase